MEKIINLFGMTQKDIKRKIRESKDTRVMERWICINSSLKGLSPTMIADILSRDEKTIREWITNFNEDGIAGIERVSPPGKKKE